MDIMKDENEQENEMFQIYLIKQRKKNDLT